MNTQNRTNVDLKELDKKYLLHPASHLAQHDEIGAQIIASGSGCTLTDVDGNKLFDAMAGLWCVNIGYGRHELADVMAEQARELAYFHLFSSQGNEPSIRLGERLVDMAGGRISKVIFGQSGSDANDQLIKIVWAYNYYRGKPQKRKFISRDQGYHGVTVASGSLTGLPVFHKVFGLPIEDFIHVSCPHYYKFGHEGESEEQYCDRLVDELETRILAEGADTIGAFIMEPIMGAGGVIVPPKGYHKRVTDLCRSYDILVIADEVICGFGRLGKAFGHHYFDFEPDMVAVAKGLTSAYFPLSASMVSEEVWQVMLEGSKEHGVFAHGFTYSGHPVGCAVALANLDIMENEGMFENADKSGDVLQAALQEAVGGHKHVGEVRGEKLICAVQLIDDKEKKTFFDPALGYPAKIYAAAREMGLICRPLPTGDALAFSPPIIITEDECRWVAKTFAAALKEVLG
ncbi:MAG: aminotransferase [Alphaproteobacteria bacterium]